MTSQKIAKINHNINMFLKLHKELEYIDHEGIYNIAQKTFICRFKTVGFSYTINVKNEDLEESAYDIACYIVNNLKYQYNKERGE